MGWLFGGSDPHQVDIDDFRHVGLFKSPRGKNQTHSQWDFVADYLVPRFNRCMTDAIKHHGEDWECIMPRICAGAKLEGLGLDGACCNHLVIDYEVRAIQDAPWNTANVVPITGRAKEAIDEYFIRVGCAVNKKLGGAPITRSVASCLGNGQRQLAQLQQHIATSRTMEPKGFWASLLGGDDD